MTHDVSISTFLSIICITIVKNMTDNTRLTNDIQLITHGKKYVISISTFLSVNCLTIVRQLTDMQMRIRYIYVLRKDAFSIGFN